MYNFLFQFIQTQNRWQTHIGHGVAWGLLPLVFISALVVILRYGFDAGSIALQETILYNHAIVFMLGMGYTYQQDKHVRVDVFYSRFSEHRKAWVNFLGGLLLALPTLFFIIWASSDYILNSWAIQESSAEAGGLGFVYLLKSVIWLMAGLLTFQILSMMAESWLKLKAPQLAEKLKNPIETQVQEVML